MTFDELWRIGISLIYAAIPILSGFTAIFIWLWRDYNDVVKHGDYLKEQIEKKLEARNG